MVRDLTDKVAWVTGAGTGIGASGAKMLAEAGMQVVLSGRREQPLKDVAERIGDRAWIQRLDVSDKGAVKQVGESILDRYDRCDVLVNSAGLNAEKQRHWRDVSLDDWDQVVDVDLNGAFYCSKAVLPTMIEQNDGLIINIASWAGKYISAVTGPAYTAAKHAMVAMTESLNMEQGIHGIRACAINPGEVDTEILDRRPIKVTDEDRSKMVKADECGEIIAFIARMPNRVCINEITVSPTWNRTYVERAHRIQNQ